MRSFFSKLPLSFQTKVLLPVIFILVLLMGITTAVVDRRITRQFEAEALEQLVTSEKVFKYFQELHTSSLLSRYRNLANEPRLKAISRLDDEKTLQTFFKELIADLDAQKLGTGAILFTSANARLQASSSVQDSLDLKEFQNRAEPSVKDIFGGQSSSVDLVKIGDKLFNLVSVGVNVSGEVTGVITFANEMGREVAQNFRQLTRSEIIFLDKNHVLVSTLNKASQESEFAAHIPEFLLSAQNPHNAAQIRLAGEHFFWRARTFDSGHGGSGLTYVLLSSFEQPWQALRETQAVLLWVRVSGAIIAALILWVIIKRITQPLREIRDSAEAVGRGDFSKRLSVASRDECGHLAASFNQMTENLKNSRDQLEKTVETLQTTRAQLVHTEKLSVIGEFVAGVAHELNNPLTTVVGFAELLNRGDVDPKQKMFAEYIIQSATRCHKIVHNLLSFARQHPPERKKVNANEIVDSVIEILQYEFKTSNVRVSKNFDPNLPPIMADFHQLQQVFLNLMNNARQALDGQSDGLIEVSTAVVDNKIRLSFTDNGPGIPPENLNRIFDPFFTTKPVGKGTGLGLSLSYGIVQEHGGNISVRSQVGHGTTFIVEFPVGVVTNVSVHSSPPTSSSSASEGQGRRLLAIDDEEPILQLTREILVESGYEVDIAQDGEVALLQIQSKPYDAILCDWKMPGLNGRQIYERLQKTDPKVANRFIFMTGDVLSEQTQKFLDQHHRICISKPFSSKEIRATIKTFLATTGADHN